MDDEPVVIDSGLSQEMEVDGYLFEVCIYRLEEETAWTLEVIDEEGTSHIWNATFASDFAAMVEAQKVIRTAGAERFMYEDSGPTLH